MRGLRSRLSDWILAHPLGWGVGCGVVLVLLGVVLRLGPVVVVLAGALVGLLNVLHARRRGYCPLPTEPTPGPVRAEGEPLPPGRGRPVAE